MLAQGWTSTRSPEHTGPEGTGPNPLVSLRLRASASSLRSPKSGGWLRRTSAADDERSRIGRAAGPRR